MADYISTPVGFTWCCALVAPVSKLLGKEYTQDLSSPLKPLIPEMEVPGLSAEVKEVIFLVLYPRPPCPVLGRVGVYLLIDLVSIYFCGVLRVLVYVILVSQGYGRMV